MVKISQRKNLFTSFSIILVTGAILYIIETAEVFKLKTKEIHNEIALAAFESCKHNSNSCTCETLAKCDLCPETLPIPKECQSTGRREFVRCLPGGHEFYKQCTLAEWEARQHFWGFYVCNGIVLFGSVLMVRQRKKFLDQKNMIPI